MPTNLLACDRSGTQRNLMATAPQDAVLAMTNAEIVFRRSHDFSLIDHTIALFRTGSHAYGTNTPESDNDYLAIVLPRMRHIVGLGGFEHFEPGVDGVTDVKAMSLKKFVKLALDGNPNVVETLFFSPDNLLYIAPAFQPFLDHNDAFLSRDVFNRFSGYAYGQTKKMISGLKTRDMGEKRFAWVEKIGYDTKDASHLIRLLYTGRELATSGKLVPSMTGWKRRVVTSIKQGEWALGEVQNLASVLSARADIYFNAPECPLPDKPNADFIEVLLMEAHREAVR